MATQAAPKTISLDYVKTIGINNNQPLGRGFGFPSDVAFSSDGRIYVLNGGRSNAAKGQRIQICNLDEEWFGEFGQGRGPADDQFGQPVCNAFDSHDRLYVTDDRLGEIKVFDADSSDKTDRELTGTGVMVPPIGRPRGELGQDTGSNKTPE